MQGLMVMSAEIVPESLNLNQLARERQDTIRRADDMT
jgi:hypothetical protein